MSPELQAALDTIPAIKQSLSFAYVIGLVVTLSASLLKLRMHLVLLIAVASASLYAAYALVSLDNWWNLVTRSIVTEEDQTWVSRHDGGMIFAGLKEIVFAGFLLGLNLAIVWLVKSVLKINQVEPVDRANLKSQLTHD